MEGTDKQDIEFFNKFLDRFDKVIYPTCFAPRGYSKPVAIQVYSIVMLSDPPDDDEEKPEWER